MRGGGEVESTPGGIWLAPHRRGCRVCEADVFALTLAASGCSERSSAGAASPLARQPPGVWELGGLPMERMLSRQALVTAAVLVMWRSGWTGQSSVWKGFVLYRGDVALWETWRDVCVPEKQRARKRSAVGDGRHRTRWQGHAGKSASSRETLGEMLQERSQSQKACGVCCRGDGSDSRQRGAGPALLRGPRQRGRAGRRRLHHGQSRLQQRGYK